MKTAFPQVFALSLADKMRLIEELWDDIAAEPEQLPVPDWQKEELARRKANFLRAPESGLSWEEVQERIKQRHG